MRLVAKRPFVISLICVLGFIGVVLNMPSVFSPETKRLGMLFPALFGFIVAAFFISFIGVWHMKKWGVELFIFTAFLRIVLAILIPDTTGILFIIGVLFWIWYISSFLYFYSRMDRNL